MKKGRQGEGRGNPGSRYERHCDEKRGVPALSWLFWLCVSELRGRGWAPAGGHQLGLTLGGKQGPGADGNSAGRSVADMALCEGGNERGREDRGGRGRGRGGEETPSTGTKLLGASVSVNVRSRSLVRPETRQILMNTALRRGVVSLVRDGRGDSSLSQPSERHGMSQLPISRLPRCPRTPPPSTLTVSGTQPSNLRMPALQRRQRRRPHSPSGSHYQTGLGVGVQRRH